MGYFKASPNESELVSIGDAYHILWGAGSIALAQSTIEPEIKAIQGQEITNIFSRLDAIRDDATKIQPARPEPEHLPITIGTLVKPLRDEINYIYAQNGAEAAENFNFFIANDERLTALMGLSLYIGAAKNSLYESRKASQ